MQQVVTPGGTGYLAAIPGFAIAGKTSTAMKSTSKGYTKDYQASFLGFFPGDNPQISVYIWLDEPKGGQYQGGKIAAPVFQNVVKKIIPIIHEGKLKKVEILSETVDKEKHYRLNKMPDFRGKSKKEVLFKIWNLYPGDHNITGKGYLTHQDPPPGQTISKPYRFSFIFNSN